MEITGEFGTKKPNAIEFGCPDLRFVDIYVPTRRLLNVDPFYFSVLGGALHAGSNKYNTIFSDYIYETIRATLEHFEHDAEANINTIIATLHFKCLEILKHLPHLHDSEFEFQKNALKELLEDVLDRLEKAFGLKAVGIIFPVENKKICPILVT